MITANKKSAIVKEFGNHETDTGSASTQIGIITSRIEQLSNHLKTHKKDHGSRRSLLKLVAARRKHMKYLERTNTAEFVKMQSRLK